VALTARARQTIEASDTSLDAGAGMEQVDAVADGMRDRGGTAAIATEEGEQEIEGGEQVAHGFTLQWSGMAAMANGINRCA